MYEKILSGLRRNNETFENLNQFAKNIPTGTDGVKFQNIRFFRAENISVPPDNLLFIFVSYDANQKPFQLYTITDNADETIRQYNGQPLPGGVSRVGYKLVMPLTRENFQFAVHPDDVILLPLNALHSAGDPIPTDMYPPVSPNRPDDPSSNNNQNINPGTQRGGKKYKHRKTYRRRTHRRNRRSLKKRT